MSSWSSRNRRRASAAMPNLLVLDFSEGSPSIARHIGGWNENRGSCWEAVELDGPARFCWGEESLPSFPQAVAQINPAEHAAATRVFAVFHRR